jgi:hypothetical protein
VGADHEIRLGAICFPLRQVWQSNAEKASTSDRARSRRGVVAPRRAPIADLVTAGTGVPTSSLILG